MTATGETTWTELAGMPSVLLDLADRCFAADGGLPLATDPGFLGRRWAGESVSAFGLRAADGSLVAAGAARLAPGGPSFTGLVDPDARGRGLGGDLLDRGLAVAARLATTAGSRPAGSGSAGGGPVGNGPAVTVETESLTDDAVVLFESRGLRQAFAEDVMRIDLGAVVPPPAKWPAGAELATWSRETAQRFHTTYHASFRDRPGFPADPADEWIAENEDDEDFLPGCSLLATLPGLGDAAFLTAARDWIVQVGVVPTARRRGLAASLISESLTRMRADGGSRAWLTVNVNNPGAAALYYRLGFAHRGRRARYRR